MFNYDKLEQAIAESGKTKTYLCKQMGRPAYYLRDVVKQKNSIPEELQKILAEELGVSVEWLNDETDKKEKPGIVAELSERDIRILNIIRKLPDDVLDALELDLYRKGLL
jgi:plasmid maintenance system antidote protein VapI